MGIIELGAAVVALLAIVAVVGVPLAVLIGLRGLWLAASAPAFALSVIGIASILAPWVGLRWSLLPVILVGVVVAMVIVLLRRFLPPGHPPPSAEGAPRMPARWTILTLLAVVAILAWQVAVVVGRPDAISQTFDNVFHLNAIRYILDTGSASSLQIGSMTAPVAGFYPAVWHAVGALLAGLTGASIPVVANALTLVVSAVFWPLGALLLGRVLAGASLASTVAAGAVAVSVPAFPLLPVDYGVLYPFHLALALLPVPLAATAAAIGIGTESARLGRGWWVLVVAGSIVGVTLAHPGGLVGWLALTVPMLIVLVVRLWRRFRRPVARTVIIGGVGAYLVAGILLLKILRPPLEARLWPTIMSPLDAVGHAFTVTLGYPAPAVFAAASVLLGLWWTLRLRTAEALVAAGMWFVGAILFVVVTSLPWGSLRDALTGSWYNNWQRLAALFAIALLPVATLGAARSAEWIVRSLPSPRLVPWVAAGGAVAVLVLAPLSAVPAAVAVARHQYVMGSDAALLSRDEYALLRRLDEDVPGSAVIAGNPYTGTSLAYALSGRRVLMPHILAYESEQMREVSEGARDAATGGAVCDAIDSLGVRFILDFGGPEVHGESHDYAGYRDLGSSGAVRLVDQQGDARLYEIESCR